MACCAKGHYDGGGSGRTHRRARLCRMRHAKSRPST
jgi:hypothetical protein